MKPILLLLFTITSMSVYATLIVPYDNSKPTGLPLPIAYDKAMNALGSSTNEFHCLSANVSTDFGPDGGWQFTFYSTNSKPKWITVEFNGKVHVEDFMVR